MFIFIFKTSPAFAADYKLLSPIGSITSVNTTTDFNNYLQTIINICIAVTATLSVIMLIIGGLQYVFSSVSETTKKDAKERITNAILGILIVLSGYLILSTIDPKLLKLDFPAVPTKDQLKPLN